MSEREDDRLMERVWAAKLFLNQASGARGEDAKDEEYLAFMHLFHPGHPATPRDGYETRAIRRGEASALEIVRRRRRLQRLSRGIEAQP